MGQQTSKKIGSINSRKGCDFSLTSHPPFFMVSEAIMKRIYLSKRGKRYKGFFTLVDDEDYEELIKRTWSVHFGNTGKKYTASYYKFGGKQKMLVMHRVVMGLSHGDKRQVDHISGNTLDNRKCNLRLCTGTQNGYNNKIQKNNTSGYKGVSWDKKNKKWKAKVCSCGKEFFLGRFNNKISAANEYNKKAIELHGEFARLNEV